MSQSGTGVPAAADVCVCVCALRGAVAVEVVGAGAGAGAGSQATAEQRYDKDHDDHGDAAESESHAMQHMMEDMDSNIDQLKHSTLCSGEEERFAFARALSRLSHMASREWVERGMGLEVSGGKKDRDDWAKVRSRQMEDSM